MSSVCHNVGEEDDGNGASEGSGWGYPVKDIQQQLTRRGNAGWGLISMEPDWHWERVYISMAMSITKPLAVKGWCLTFERQQDTSQPAEVSQVSDPREAQQIFRCRVTVKS